MAISFNEIPAALRVPFVFAEFDSSNALGAAALMPFKVLVCGQKLATGTQAELTPVRITSAEQAATLFGAGSMLAQALAMYLENDAMTEVWGIAVDDLAAGVKATGALTVTGAATESGTLALYVGGRRIRVAVTSGDQPTAIATAIAAAVNAATDSPCTATSNAGVVTLSAQHKGEAGNGIDLRLNYYSESTPAGVAVAIVAMSGGTGNPDADEVIAAMADTQYHVICWPWTDTASLVAIEAELLDRSGPLRMIEGQAIASAVGTHGTLGTLGDSRNSPHLTIMHAHGVPTPTWELAAAVTAVAAFYGNIDPARPFQTLPLSGVLPPAEADRFTMSENNLLLFDGISTFTVDAGGVVRVQRLITTYKTNAAGADDAAYLDLNTPLTLSYLRHSFRGYILRKYPRHKLADDGNNFGPGQAVMTPKLGKAEAIAWARAMENLGLMENIDAFGAAVLCERNATDRNRLDWMLPTDLVNQFVVGAVKISFIL
ncbi:MAG: phage tail sheath subtilisin-like domain-containing protein [Proteobacteria bacterium]|nr:phage tail sheath subtilisin-like domain-containing protein [Pseudomonadota bacterium]MBU1594264.1 phage tail sheath subtilisin-like domain-containing protein [Pseudomonadota bacterium]